MSAFRYCAGRCKMPGCRATWIARDPVREWWLHYRDVHAVTATRISIFTGTGL